MSSWAWECTSFFPPLFLFFQVDKLGSSLFFPVACYRGNQWSMVSYVAWHSIERLMGMQGVWLMRTAVVLEAAAWCCGLTPHCCHLGEWCRGGGSDGGNLAAGDGDGDRDSWEWQFWVGRWWSPVATLHANGSCDDWETKKGQCDDGEMSCTWDRWGTWHCSSLGSKTIDCISDGSSTYSSTIHWKSDTQDKVATWPNDVQESLVPDWCFRRYAYGPRWTATTTQA